MHQAAVTRRNGIVELLIGKGLDVNAKDELGGTPLDSAISRKQTEITDLLRKHGGKTGAELELKANETPRRQQLKHLENRHSDCEDSPFTGICTKH